jgi:hypothetical protein
MVEGYCVLAEYDLVVEIAVGGEGFEGFFAFLGGFLVYRGEYATGAGFDAYEAVGADGELAPGLFFIGLASGKDEVGAEAVHGEGCVQAGIEVVEGFLADDEEGIGVGQTYVLVVYLIPGVYGAGVLFGEIDEFAGNVYALREPGAIGGVYFVGHDQVVPNLHGAG